MRMFRNIIIFGATGSIGTSVLNVIRRNRSNFNVIGISANTSVEKLAQIAHEFNVQNVGIFDEHTFAGKDSLFKRGTQFFFGENGLCELAKLSEVTAVIMAIVGIAGLRPTMVAIENKKTILLASKEILVTAGKFIIESAKQRNVRILPVDSEHNAIFQCLRGNDGSFVDRLILTASGGPFRNFSHRDMENITVAQALHHPVWNMGKKITIDSATMANKGLEIVEAKWLFNVPSDNIDVVVHPESIVHSMVKFCDGSVIAQMCPPNMEYPIANCLFFPERERLEKPSINFAEQGSLNFFAPDVVKFPHMSIIRQCLKSSNNACAVFQAANEVAVDAFLSHRIKFTQISEVVSKTLDVYTGEPMTNLKSCEESVIKAHGVARGIVQGYN
ncbi:MAG: 1-deoxy-D-xylulose-5-phosphate reductoisomerase [Puniceicoccales bacterium]|jgi:1-deoxy-D-xylulose-5-phosphate reductoisomerase|nr:1-deoxy-D-xylulose-5-phosphate reductoisomerase [Puniceicoccales bacterium]